MRTIRRNVFETNSSSCHSISIFSRNIWEKFQNGEIVFKPNTFDYEEHIDQTNRFSDENFEESFMSFDSFFEQTVELVNDYERPSSYETNSSRKYHDLRLYTFKSLLTKDFLRNVLINSSSGVSVQSIQPPLVVDWHWGGTSTYDRFTTSDMYEVLCNIWGYSAPESIYSSSWRNDVTISGDKENIFELSYQGILENIPNSENSLICSDESVEVTLDKENKKIIVRNKSAEKVIVERDVEC